MSNRYKGGIISATPPTTTGGESGTASGAWTLEQQMQAQAAGLWPIQPPPLYIEDVFSTWLYTGNGATQTITNGIDLAGDGGLVWIKSRAGTYVREHYLYDTARGTILSLSTDTTGANVNNSPNGVTAFNSDGFTALGPLGAGLTASGTTYASWTFRKQPKFFDVVTWNGNSVSGRQIPHNLGSVPGCILVKVTSVSGSWFVWHRSMGGNNFYMTLNSPDPRTNGGAPYWNNTGPTDTVFTVGNDSDINQTGRTYVAYLFAHDAGGFGPTESENVISCGSLTTDGSGNATVNLGYEPQWVMVKQTNATQNWYIEDNMRAFNLTSRAILFPNLSNAEATGASAYLAPNATGFSAVNGQLSASGTYIYIAIRRGPMKVPESGTSVFESNATSAATGTTLTTGFPVDLQIWSARASSLILNRSFIDRLRGVGTTATDSNSPYLLSPSTDAEATSYANTRAWSNTGFSIADVFGGINSIYWNFRRAPGFFDEVCYTGTGSVTTQAHNLGVAPELLIVKRRDTANYAPVWSKSIGDDYILKLFDIQATSDDPKDGPTDVQFNQTAPTASVFTLGTSSSTNGSGSTYVAWMWATLAGVSKVGSYTGTGTTKQIDCGFTAGARFVMIKRTDGTGDWYVWDSARGIVAGNDPYLLLNSSAAEVTNTDYIDTTSVGFEISSTAPAAINASGGTFIFLAIA